MGLRITLFLSTISTVALVHIISTEFFLYWKYLWLDIPVHILGGIACVLGFSILPFFRITLPTRYETLMWYTVGVLCVGVVWEVFEIIMEISHFEPGFVLNTVRDLAMDIIGGIIGYGIIRSIKSIEA